jgi:uncharacterized protein YndB with AHSA1/START domain
MNPIDTTARSQTEAISFEFDLPHAPEKVWRALTDPALLAEWLLPVARLELEPGAAFTYKAPPQPGWDGSVHCRLLEIEDRDVGARVRQRERDRTADPAPAAGDESDASGQGRRPARRRRHRARA